MFYSLPINPRQSHKWKLKLISDHGNVCIGIISENYKRRGLAYRGNSSQKKYYYLWANGMYPDLYTHHDHS